MSSKGLAVGLFIAAMFLAPIRVLAETGANYQWIQNDMAIGEYEDIYIYHLDLREMIVEVNGDEARGISEESIDSSALENIAKDLYQKFAQRLNGILPINKSQNIDKTRKSLVLKVKISGRFPYQDRGLLMGKLVGPPEQKTSVGFECHVYDAATEKDLLIIKDSREFVHKAAGEPLASDEDMAKMSEILDSWAGRFAEILLEKREMGTVQN